MNDFILARLDDLERAFVHNHMVVNGVDINELIFRETRSVRMVLKYLDGMPQDGWTNAVRRRIAARWLDHPDYDAKQWGLRP